MAAAFARDRRRGPAPDHGPRDLRGRAPSTSAPSKRDHGPTRDGPGHGARPAQIGPTRRGDVTSRGDDQHLSVPRRCTCERGLHRSDDDVLPGAQGIRPRPGARGPHLRRSPAHNCGQGSARPWRRVAWGAWAVWPGWRQGSETVTCANRPAGVRTTPPKGGGRWRRPPSDGRARRQRPPRGRWRRWRRECAACERGRTRAARPWQGSGRAGG